MCCLVCTFLGDHYQERFTQCYGTVVLSVTLVYYGQAVGWIKMPLGTEVGLGPGHTVLNGDPAPPMETGTAPPPLFGQCLLWPNGWMDQDTTWYGGRPRPRRNCVRWGPSSITERGTAAPTFRPMSSVAKQSPISATTELSITRMWANAQRDGRPAEHRWRPLFNAAKPG